MKAYPFLALLAAPLFLAVPAEAKAEETVECVSQGSGYTECYAGMLSQPQLVYQISSSGCIINRSWGFNPRTGYIWVANGCSGVFADVAGYHHGRGDTYDEGARHYDRHGHDAGKVVGGLVLGALLEAAIEPKNHTTSNVSPHHHSKKHSECHGSGCLVTPPSDRAISQLPRSDRGRFDREGNPNFDAEGNYQGCHGMGCVVDNPDRR